MSIAGESIGIDSENYLWGKLRSDHKDNFSLLIHCGNFNHQRRRLHPFIERLNKCVAGKLNEFEDVYLVDSIPVLVCQIAREKRSKICEESFATSPDKGYSTVSGSYYYGYKLHLATSVRGVFHSMDLTKTSVHDVHYLSEVKRFGLYMCILITDKGYLSSTYYQLDLFNSCQVNP